MKRTIIVVGAVLASLFLVTGTASAGDHASSHQAHRRCTSDYSLTYSLPNASAQFHWTHNGTCRFWGRAVIHCQDGRNNIIYTGRWVQANDVRSDDNCTAAYPVLAGVGYDWKIHSSSPYTRVWKYGKP